MNNEKNAEQLQRALAMSMKGDNGNDEIGSSRTAPIETNADTETNEQRLQHALAMSVMAGNDFDELAASKENFRLTQLVGQY